MRRFLLVCTVVLTALLVWKTIAFIALGTAMQDRVDQWALDTTLEFEADVDDLLMRVEAKAAEMAEVFGSREMSRAELESYIEAESLGFRELRGITACYMPNALSDAPEDRLVCPYYNKTDGTTSNVGDFYDYSVRSERSNWLYSIVDGGAQWVEPYYSEAYDDWFIDYGVPFYFSNGPREGELRGIIDLSLVTADFKTLVHDLSVGKIRESYIVTEGGTFISHPDSDKVGTTTIDSWLETAELPDSLRDGMNRMQAGGSGSEVFYSEDGEQMMFQYDHLKTNGYGVGLVFSCNDIVTGQERYNRAKTVLALIASALAMVVLTLIFKRNDGRVSYAEIEWISALTAILLVFNIVFIGALRHNMRVEVDPNESQSILDLDALQGFLNAENKRAEMLKIAPPIAIPTGIYIERMEFADSYNVNIGGVAWKKYPLAEDLPEGVPELHQGLRFPQISPFAEASMVEETYRRIIEAKEGERGYELVGYEFRVTLRLNLSYGDYPFDKRHLDIQLAPATRGDNVILVPDLSGYAVTAPVRKAGIDPAIELPGSTIQQTYYNFSMEEYETDFGFGNAADFSHVAALHFNIHQKRKLLNAFVTYLIPIVVALALIYILILSCRKTGDRQGVIESMAAFFFVLIFSHIDLRKDVVTADLMFIEYFYFATYLMIILSTMNLIFYTKSKTSLFDYNDNQLFRAAYFPIFFALILIVTLVKFY